MEIPENHYEIPFRIPENPYDMSHIPIVQASFHHLRHHHQHHLHRSR